MKSLAYVAGVVLMILGMFVVVGGETSESAPLSHLIYLKVGSFVVVFLGHALCRWSNNKQIFTFNFD
jgi:hypothetical protein